MQSDRIHGKNHKNTRYDVLKYLGEEDVERIYGYADVFHCEPIEKVADDFIQKAQIPQREPTIISAGAAS